jgi:undecaprenyl pyrophosphate phosphatase UppP
MIRFIYKIVHFETSLDHKDDVMKSFLFIWIFASIIPFVLLYLMYNKFIERSIYLDYALVLMAILISILLYYAIRIRQAKTFIERGLDREYYDFGRYNTILKTLAILAILGLIILLGRAAMFILR